MGKDNPYMKAGEVLKIQKARLPKNIPMDHFLSDRKLKKIINHYRKRFRPRPPKPDELLTFDVNDAGMPSGFYRGEVLSGPASDRHRHFYLQQIGSWTT